MKSKTVMIAIVATMLIGVDSVDAKSYGGGGRSSSGGSRSSYSSRPSGGGLFNRSSSKKATTPEPSSPSKYSGNQTANTSKAVNKEAPKVTQSPASTNKSIPVTKGKTTALVKGNRFDQNASKKLQAQQAAQSKQAYEKEKAKFTAKPKTPVTSETARATYSKSPVYSKTTQYGRVNYSDRYQARDSYYAGRGWSAPPYVYNSYSSFGMWDYMFLWMMLDNANDRNYASMAYHHSNDPGFKEWKTEANRLANENSELKAKLATLDSQVSALEKEGIPRNDGYLPEGVDSSIVLSDEALASIPPTKPTLKVSTGVAGGNYEKFGKHLVASIKGVTVETVNSSGSLDNLKRLQAGEVDATIVQSDTFDVFRSMNPTLNPVAGMQATLFSEYVMLLVSKDSGVDSITDIDSNFTVYTGPSGSGSAVTWVGFGLQNPNYKSIKTVSTTWEEAFKIVREDPQSAAFIVIGSDSQMLKNLNGFKLVSVDDSKLAERKDENGNSLYDSLWVEKSSYPNLLDDNLQTLAVDAVWVLRESWPEKFGVDAFDNANYAVTDAIVGMHLPGIETSHSIWPKILMWGGIIVAVLFIGYLLVTKVDL